ncbi:hypothetical protein KP509_26G054400 [Ceratopteris richardii]|uniref:Uncharacterized protein n=1 Tax=Ceratopteris richardii TaxID=49495 RepID=A0A8T2RN64_CERRI|nr:hypothetical protein KP509_26G054400 [Ceratopteris richardii]
MFAGYGNENRQTNDVYVFDTVKQTWSKPVIKGTTPPPRDSHSCTTVGASLFVFGGTNGSTPLRDLYILDTTTNVWSKPQTEGEGPAPREGHSAALIGRILFIFGGCGKSVDDSHEIYFNDLYMLDTVKLCWTKASTKGTPPSPRDSHTCSAWNNHLVVVGGEDATDLYLSDVHLLDTDVMEWREVHATGDTLLPRAGHATVAIGRHLFVLGGFTDDRKLYSDLNLLNLESGVWSNIIAANVGPSARFSVAGDSIDIKPGFLVFFGGCNENLEALDDMYYLDTETQVERSVNYRTEKSSLKKELKRKRQESQIIIKRPEVEKGDTIETEPKIIPPPLPSSPPGVGLFELKPIDEKIFDAKITDVFHYGYTIESKIDGKSLRGLLFSYKPGFAHAVHAHLTRKKLLSEGSISEVPEARKQKLKIARASKHSLSACDGQSTTPSEYASLGESAAGQLITLPPQQQQYQEPDPQSLQMPLTQSQSILQSHVQHRQTLQSESQQSPQSQSHPYLLPQQQYIHWQQQQQQQQQHFHYPQTKMQAPPGFHPQQRPISTATIVLHSQQRSSLNTASPAPKQPDTTHQMGHDYMGSRLSGDLDSHNQSSSASGVFSPPCKGGPLKCSSP